MNTDRRPLITILLVGGGLVIYLGAQINDNLPLEKMGDAGWALFPGLVLFLLGLAIHQNVKGAEWIVLRLEHAADWFGITAWQFVLLIVSPLFAVLAAAGAGFWFRMYSPFAAVSAWLLGMALVIVGGLHWQTKWTKPARATLIWLGALTLFAFLLRGTFTGRIPILLTGDEASAGINALDFVSGEWNNLFITGWFSFPTLYMFIQSLSIRLFGQTTEALRLVSALAGALTVGGVYLYGKALFGQRVGIYAALTLAVLHFHIHFSRIGLNNIWDGLWYVVALGALCYAWEFNSRPAYLLAGLGLGFGQYFYVSGRGLFGIIFLALLIAFLFQRQRLKEALPGLALMALITFAVTLPLAWFYIQHPEQFFAPMERVSFFKQILEPLVVATGKPAWQIITEQIWTSFKAYTHTPVVFWYKPETPILRPIFAVFFYIGLILLPLKHRDSRFVVLILWLFIFGLLGGLSDSVPAAQRYVAAAPACALLVGYGLHKSSELLENLWSRSARVISNLSVLILVVAMFSDLYFYFFDYYGKSLLENINSNGMVAQQLADNLQDKPAGTQVVFLHNSRMGYYSIASVRYLAPQVTGLDAPGEWQTFDRSQLTASRLIFVALPESAAELETIRGEYPGGLLTYETNSNGGTLFWLYEVDLR